MPMKKPKKTRVPSSSYQPPTSAALLGAFRQWLDREIAPHEQGVERIRESVKRR